MIQANVVVILRSLAERDTALQHLTDTSKIIPTPILPPRACPRSRTPRRLGTALVLTVRLLSVARPTGRGHWVATEIFLPIPRHLPTITTHPTKPQIARFHLAYTEPDAPARDPKTPITSVVGIDWSPSALGVMSRVTASPVGASSSAFEGHRYEDRGLGIKLFRLQQEGEILSGKIARTGHLSDELPEDSPVRARLEAKIAIWKQLLTALGAKRARVNRELAFHFANGATDYAQATGATILAIEDLSTLGAGGIGRVNNNKVAQSARRKAVHATTHLGTRAGLEVIDVPARGTSAHCPGCDHELTRPGGYHRARCRVCGLEGNRDQIAAVNIAKRAITGQDSLTTDRKTGRKRIRKAVHAPVKRVRPAKHSPTPRRTRHKRVRNSVAPKAVKPAKTIFPAPPGAVWDAEKPPGTPLLPMPRCQGVTGIRRRYAWCPGPARVPLGAATGFGTGPQRCRRPQPEVRHPSIHAAARRRFAVWGFIVKNGSGDPLAR